MASYETMQNVLKESEYMELKKKTLVIDEEPASDSPPEYKYKEDEFLKELTAHVDGTYVKHYSGEIQTIEYIMSKAKTLDYLRGNVFKYVDRYGKKNGKNNEDLYKAVHYIMMMAKYGEKLE